MENENIRELIDRFNTQQSTPEDIRKIEALLESGQIELHQLNDLQQLEGYVEKMQYPGPSPDLDDRFYRMLALEKKSKSSFSWRGFFSWPELAPKLAIASLTLIIGFGVGYWARPAATNGDQETQLLTEVQELKEMMMLSLLEKDSPTDRLKAVSLSRDLDETSTKVTDALIATLNNDENVNVRLSALDALRTYVRDSRVRTELIRSISNQESPLVQLALAELMVDIQAKSSVKELEKIMQSENTPADVKQKIKQSIDVLI